MKQWLCLLLLATPLTTAGVEDTHFGKLDRDSDGQLSPREVAALSLNFRELDTDDDGYLSRSELRYANVGAPVETDDEESAAVRNGRQ